MAKKLYEQLGEELINSSEEVSIKKINKADFDKSYKTTIVGCNRYFTDDVPAETQAELIKKYNIPEVSVSGVYYTFRINGNWYVKSSNNDFKLYEEVIVRVPNGNWDNMFIEVQRDTVVEGGSGVGKNVGNASEIFNRYEGSNANVIDGGYAAHAEGSQNTITGASLASHAEGTENRIIRSKCGHAEGNFTSISNSDYSHTEGQSNHINGASWAHAGGYGSHIMSGADCGFAHGYGARVLGAVSAALGYQTLASGRNQLVAGEANIEDTEDKYSLIIGNGTGIRGLSGFAPSNALTLDRDGNLWVSGSLNYSGGAVTNYTAGRGIEINNGKIGMKIASKNVLGGVKAGDGVEIAADGTISVTGGAGGGSYTAGSGIEIAEDNTISVTPATETAIGGIILGKGLEYDPSTGKTNTVPNIQQAVIIQEADAKYLLHEYTMVDYIAGNKIVYAGAGNQIIVDGMVVFKLGGIAPNGIALPSDYNPKNYSLVSMSELSTEVPNPPFYSSVSLPKNGKWYSSNAYYVNKFELLLTEAHTDYDVYTGYSYEPDGTQHSEYSFANYYGFGGYGHFYLWENIYPPGSAVAGETWEFGCACCSGFKLFRDTNYSGGKIHITIVRTASKAWYFPFVSEAEYNAAVGLTYEPNTLTQVNETITEV